MTATKEMRLVFDAMPVAVAHCDAEQRYVFANKAYAARFGLTPEELVGRPVVEVLGEELCAQINPYTQRVLAGESVQYEAEAEYAAVGRRHVHCSCTPVWDDAGRVTGWVATVTDVTEYHRTEQDLRAREELLRTLTNGVPHLMWVNAPDGSTRHYNDRWRAYTGVAPEQSLHGTRWMELMHADDVEAMISSRCRGIASGEPYEIEYRLRRHSGDYRWHICRVVPIRGAAGELEGWIGTATDIHDVKEAERVLREADRRKDEFLATLAHELRNPLAPIRNAVQILRMQGEEANGDALFARDIIDRQVQQLARLVDDLLDVSRITRGTIELRKERADVAAIVEQALETSRPLLDAASHNLSVALPSEPLWVMADVTRLAQVLANLLNNAAKYTRPGGHIHLAVECDGDDAVIRVHDDGIGIPPQMLSRIFEMFAQVDTSLERAQGGLGLGLTIAQRLVDMHGGTITAASDGPGTGSELIVRLPRLPRLQEPRANAAADSGGRQTGEPQARAELKVLVVDDNNDSADSLAIWLELAGHQVRTAYDGPQALAAAEEFLPRVILLDIGMPGMSGYDVARRLRAQPATRDVLLLAMTGWGQDEDRRKSREAGFDEHLVKPVDPQLLKDLLARHGGRQDP